MKKNSIVIYKSQCAIIKEIENDKYVITYCSVPATPTGKKAVYSDQKVREKDIVLLHEGPCSTLENILNKKDETIKQKIQETYELLQSDETTANEIISINDLAEYSLGSFDAENSWLLFSELNNNPQFCLIAEDFKTGKINYKLRSQEEINQINQKT